MVRLADPYVWLDVQILDALCEIGRRHEHPLTATWADAMLADEIENPELAPLVAAVGVY